MAVLLVYPLCQSQHLAFHQAHYHSVDAWLVVPPYARRIRLEHLEKPGYPGSPGVCCDPGEGSVYCPQVYRTHHRDHAYGVSSLQQGRWEHYFAD